NGPARHEESPCHARTHPARTSPPHAGGPPPDGSHTRKRAWRACAGLPGVSSAPPKTLWPQLLFGLGRRMGAAGVGAAAQPPNVVWSGNRRSSPPTTFAARWSAPALVEALIPGRVKGYGTPEEVLPRAA